jgi:hypothetical protein
MQRKPSINRMQDKVITSRHPIKCAISGTHSDAAEASGLPGHGTAANKFFENVAEFKHLGMTPTNQNSIHQICK